MSPYASRIRPVDASFVGMVNVNVPVVTVCEPKVNTATAGFPAAVSLYMRMASNAVPVKPDPVVQDAEGVKNAVVPLLLGGVAMVKSRPPAT